MTEKKEQNLEEKILDHAGTAAALSKAGREHVLQLARAGHAVSTWQDGKVVWLQPEEVIALLTNGHAQS